MNTLPSFAHKMLMVIFFAYVFYKMSYSTVKKKKFLFYSSSFSFWLRGIKLKNLCLLGTHCAAELYSYPPQNVFKVTFNLLKYTFLSLDNLLSEMEHC